MTRKPRFCYIGGTVVTCTVFIRLLCMRVLSFHLGLVQFDAQFERCLLNDKRK